MQAFISHAAKDRQVATRLAVELVRAGFAVWNADDDIAPGDNWAKKMGDVLDASDVIIASNHAGLVGVRCIASGHPIRADRAEVRNTGWCRFSSALQLLPPARMCPGFC